MRQVFALQEDPRAAGGRGEPLRLEHRRGAPDVVREQAAQLGLKRRIIAGDEIGALELLDRLDQRFGDETAAELAVVAAGVSVAS